MKLATKTTAALALAAALVAAPAFADRDDLRAIKEAKVSLIQAIQAAEKSQGGKAVDASIDDDSFRPTYEVSVVKDDRFYDVQVDAVSGDVLGSREDLDD